MARKSDKDRLSQLFDQLPGAQQAQLLDYAEFLHERHAVPVAVDEPVKIPRPEEESVIQALKRLRETYPMLDPGLLLNETTAMMNAHLLQGKPAREVIDECESLFAKYYQELKDLSESS